MSNYKNKTDLEVNQRLADLLKIPTKVEHGSLFIDNGWEDGACVYTYVDYCNRWQDIGNLMIKYNITLIPNEDSEGDCQACHLDGFFDDLAIESGNEVHATYDYCAYDSNPLRAITICLIKMLEN